MRTIITAPKTQCSASLGQLWEKYTSYKFQELAATTIKKDFATVARHISKTSGDLSEARKIRLELMEITTMRSAKKTLMQINACCTWAVDFGLLEANPFERVKIKAKKLPPDIQPFTEGERDHIIAAFKEKEQHYAPLVEFLFLTGCRPSEAIALRWKHVDAGLTQINFCEAFVYGVSKGTKTDKSRVFPINSRLRSLLSAIKPASNSGESLLFPSKTGSIVNQHNLVRRQWRQVLENLGIRSRPIYNCRHTFITFCLTKNIHVRQVALWVGNSPRTIWEHYAGLVVGQEVPE